MADALPAWAWEVLACPVCHGPLGARALDAVCARCGGVATVRDGVALFGASREDPTVAWYEAKGGSNFQDRMRIPFTMTFLDSPVYRRYLEALAPHDRDVVVADVGAGDGRNTEPWLARGARRVVALDAVAASLARFRAVVQEHHPEWLDRLLLVQCDARALPLRDRVVGVALAVEALCCLNEDYRVGLAECARVLAPAGRLLVSERAWEGGVLTRLLYDGIGAMAAMRSGRDLYDGPTDNLVRTRTFTEAELLAELAAVGLVAEEVKGVSALSIVMGFLRGLGRIRDGDEQHLPAVQELMTVLGEQGAMRRAHVVVARGPGPAA